MLPGSKIDDYLFSPCGYSANGVIEDAYWTIHVTPQPEFSYVSFETNYIFGDYKEIIDKVLATFKPGRFVVSLFANTSAKCTTLPKITSYTKSSSVAYDFDNYELSVQHYTSKGKK